MSPRFSNEHLDAWRKDGAVVIEDFFTPQEVAAVAADFETAFGRSQGEAEALVAKRQGELGRFNPKQFLGVRPVPLDCGPALNLIGVHPAIVAFARAALRTPDVHVYQCQAWAKFTGEADYDQPFHTDFSNHTLTAPSEDATRNSVTILCYFTDVTEAHGPMHYVPRTASEAVAGPEESILTARSGDAAAAGELQARLAPLGRSSASRAGTAIPYTIDVYHRGTNLTAPGGRRYALMTCFKRAGDESIGFHAWAFHHTQPWSRIFDHASPEQLACFGVHPPGHPFWTPVTIQRAQARYPNWDMTPWRERMGRSLRPSAA
jgi:hypothetical protein